MESASSTEQNEQKLYTGWRIKCTNNAVYTIDSHLAKNVYIVSLKDSNRQFCMKVEWNEANARALRREVSVLLDAERYSKKKFEQFFGLVQKGRVNGKFRWMITELGGPNLDEYRNNDLIDSDFQKKEAIDLCIQTFSAIYDLHSLGYVHRNIRPSKFVFGRNDMNAVYMVGFSMAHSFRQSSSSRLSPFSFLMQTFVPRSVHKGKRFTRRDDLESWIYLCVNLFGRTLLPWDQKMNNMNMFVMKEQLFCDGFPQLFKYVPIQFQIIMKNLDKTAAKKPDYALIAMLIMNAKEQFEQTRSPSQKKQNQKSETPKLLNPEALLELTAKSDDGLEEVTANSNSSAIKQYV